MVDRDSILDVLRTIDDPEMPISIVDLGLVSDIRIGDAPDAARSTVDIDLIPTFLGCPALDLIREQVVSKLSAKAGAGAVRVHWVRSPPWSVDRISDAGRERLRQFGVSTPARACGSSTTDVAPSTGVTMLTVGGQRAVPTPACPYCASDNTRMESAFGPTRCRMIFYCPDCKNSFEQLKAI